MANKKPRMGRPKWQITPAMQAALAMLSTLPTGTRKERAASIRQVAEATGLSESGIRGAAPGGAPTGQGAVLALITTAPPGTHVDAVKQALPSMITDSIYKALFRLAKAGAIVRLRTGVYQRKSDGF